MRLTNIEVCGAKGHYHADTLISSRMSSSDKTLIFGPQGKREVSA